MHIFKSAYFSAHHRPNMVILFFIKSWPWEFLWGKGLFMKVLNHSKLFPDSQPANKQYLLIVFVVDWMHTGIHKRNLLCFSAVLWKHCSYSLSPVWRAIKPCRSVVPTDLPEVSIMKWLMNIYSIIINDKK